MSGNKSLLMNQFLKEPEKELHSYDSISEKNCRAIQQLKNEVTSLTAASTSSEDYSVVLFNTVLKIRKDNVLQKIAATEHKLEMIAMNTAIRKKAKVVKNLEQQLKEVTIEYEKLRLEKETEEQQDRTTIKIFEKALKYYTTCYQYIIDEVSIEEEDRFEVAITFVFEGLRSQYPVRFVFDEKIDSLISFNAGDLLNEKQHAILHQRFKESNNYSALFVTLRHAALRKHKS